MGPPAHPSLDLKDSIKSPHSGEGESGTIICHLALHFCRIHTMAGVVSLSAMEAVRGAEQTYVDNLKYAADLCAQVHKAVALW